MTQASRTAASPVGGDAWVPSRPEDARVPQDRIDPTVLPGASLRPALIRLAYRFLRDAHDAEEVVQEALLLSWQHSGDLRDAGRLSAWLYRTTINQAMNRLRRRRPGRLDHDPPTANGASGLVACERGELADRVREALGELPERQQAALVLRDLEGLNYDHLAAVMDVRPGAARILVHRARERLRTTLLRRWPDSFR